MDATISIDNIREAAASSDPVFHDWAGRRVATPLCGSNLTAEQLRDWL